MKKVIIIGCPGSGKTTFAEKSLPRIYELVEKYKADKQVIIFKSREETDEYINKMR